jgi:hypothetical protein
MIKGLRPGPTVQYFTRKPPQTLEKLLQKMDEYIKVDNDFRQRREEAYRYSEMTRGFGRRIHPRHVRTILSHPVLEGKPNANHARVRIRNSHTQRLHNWTSSHIAQSKWQKGTFKTSRCPRHPQSL